MLFYSAVFSGVPAGGGNLLSETKSLSLDQNVKRRFSFFLAKF